MPVRLFIGNLPYSATEADLRAHVAAVAPPVSVVLPMDRETGRPRGFAFVDYPDLAVATEVIRKLNGQPFLGRMLSVSEARPREERGPRPPMGFGGPPRARRSAGRPGRLPRPATPRRGASGTSGLPRRPRAGAAAPAPRGAATAGPRAPSRSGAAGAWRIWTRRRSTPPSRRSSTTSRPAPRRTKTRATNRLLR